MSERHERWLEWLNEHNPGWRFLPGWFLEPLDRAFRFDTHWGNPERWWVAALRCTLYEQLCGCPPDHPLYWPLLCWATRRERRGGSSS